MSLVDLGDNVKELRAKHGMLVSKNSEVYARLVVRVACIQHRFVTPINCNLIGVFKDLNIINTNAGRLYC